MTREAREHAGRAEAEVGPPWIKSACLECGYTSYGPEPQSNRCPNDKSVMMQMDGLIVADDIFAIARMMVKADHHARVAKQESFTAKVEYDRARQLLGRRIAELSD